MHSLKTTTLIGIVVVLAIIAGLLLSLSRISNVNEALSITSFADCKAAGYPVMESYPEQCRTPDGRLFVNEAQVAPPAPESTGDAGAGAAGGTFPAGECVPAGCSQTLCVEASEASDIVTTCEYRAEYACYKKTTCERQSDGKCGWTPTTEFQQCLANPPALDASVQAM